MNAYSETPYRCLAPVPRTARREVANEPITTEPDLKVCATRAQEHPMNALTQEFLDQDPDPTETREWIESIQAVIHTEGAERAHQLLEKAVDEARRADGTMPLRSC